jgi:hypothetical protein
MAAQYLGFKAGARSLAIRKACVENTTLSPTHGVSEDEDVRQIGLAGVAGAQPMRGGRGACLPTFLVTLEVGAEQRRSDVKQSWLERTQGLSLTPTQGETY